MCSREPMVRGLQCGSCCNATRDDAPGVSRILKSPHDLRCLYCLATQRPQTGTTAVTRIAVVGDVHGHLELLYGILGRWQRETRVPIDLILQVGDLGAMPESLDRATTRHATRDPEELGFGLFAGDSPPASLLDPRPPLVFIPGNHEDFEFLSRCGDAAGADALLVPVTRDKRILELRSGRVWTSDSAGALSVAGVSGVAKRGHKRHTHPRLHLKDDDALAIGARGRGEVDILISHERPSGIEEGFKHDLGGSEALRLLIEEAQPRLAFFGHYDRAGEWAIGSTRVIGLAGCGYERRGAWRVKQGAIAIVDWDGFGFAVSKLSTPWMLQSTRDNWRHWGAV